MNRYVRQKIIRNGGYVAGGPRCAMPHPEPEPKPEKKACGCTACKEKKPCPCSR